MILQNIDHVYQKHNMQVRALQEKDDILRQNMLVAIEHLCYCANNWPFRAMALVLYLQEWDDRKGKSDCSTSHPCMDMSNVMKGDTYGNSITRLRVNQANQPLPGWWMQKIGNERNWSNQNDTITGTAPQDTLWE